jgi:hypothetical protein
MMTSDSIPTEGIAFAPAREREEDLLRLRVVLMGALEASLQRSRKALLALDLAEIEAGTSDQVGLLREFDALLQRGRAAALAADRPAELRGSDLPARSPELDEELRRSQNRILDCLRLQAALLKRTQSKLRVLANMLAGPTVSYGPFRAREGGLGGLNSRQEERSDSCRA